ncbi:MAG: hypothetical protein L0Z63_07205 [Actinobacteria bacterium]|nr:hypothetical protein [Actinomycetota bacterium]
MSLAHAEYLKLSRRKLYPLMLAILFVLVALTAFFLLIFGQLSPELAEEVPVVPKPEAYIFGAQQVAGQTWFPLILGVVILGGELGSTVWATSLTREPSVFRHVVARVVVFTGSSWLAFLLGTALWAGVAFFASPGEGGPSTGEWLGLVWRVGLVAVVWSSLGLAAVALLRSVGPAIGVALAFSFLEGILALWAPYENVSVSAATSGLFGATVNGPMGGFFPGGDLSLTHSVLILAVWAMVGLVLSWWGLRRSDA